VEVVEMPFPAVSDFDVLIATQRTLISTGTERAALARGGGPGELARKAITDVDLRRKALSRLRSQGIAATLDEAKRRGAKLRPLGYSAAGHVLKIGNKVSHVSIGQRVAAGGSAYATHAEVISVPASLVTPVPDGLSFDEAAFATVGAIALHGFRLSNAGVADTLVVVGLGLVGQIAIQIAAAAGCRVLGVDPHPDRWRRAQALVTDGTFLQSLSDLTPTLQELTGGAGADAILVTAASSDASLANSCLRSVRDHGRLVIVGDIRLDLDRDAMYYNEASVVVSRSYGPGRYDPWYEERGLDYPVGEVRWTEGRNLAAVLDLIHRGRIDVRSLITAVVPLGEAARAYELAADAAQHLGVLLSYAATPTYKVPPSVPAQVPTRAAHQKATLGVAVVGPGSFATSVLVPALRATPGAVVRSVVARRPADAATGARLFSAPSCSGSLDDVLADPSIDALIVATQHDTHADIAVRGLLAGKHVFVEKPLGLTVPECEAVVMAASSSDRLCMVDFNRRFSPHARLLRRELCSGSPGATAIYRVIARPPPHGHWTLDPFIGGGQAIGEAVHFLDLLCWLFDSEPSAVLGDPRAVLDPLNEVVCTLVFPRGRSATLVYSSQGSPGSSKEWIEVLSGGHTWTLDNFRTTRRDGRVLLTGRHSKGHKEALGHFVKAALGQSALAVTALDGLRATKLALDVQRRGH
jgi:predicted dehydrogenase/threonine dehydrogenase-like Zn-dependent dehydrogenase